MKTVLSIKTLALFIFSWLIAFPGLCQKDSLIKLTPSLYEITGMGGNVACKITSDGVVLIDAGTTSENGKRILELVRSITDKPVKYIILTHYHNDHVGGLQEFPGNITIIAQNNLLIGLKNDKDYLVQQITTDIPQKINQLTKDLTVLKPKDKKKRAEIDSSLKAETANLEKLKNTRIVFPTLTYEKEMTLFLGADTVVITYSGPAHTNGDSWVYFKNDNVVHLGDMLFTNSFPYIDDRNGSSTQNWITVLKMLASNKYGTYIPGHNAIASSGDLLKLAAYLEDLRNAVASEIASGKTMEATVKSVKLNDYNGFGFQFFREQNVGAVYMELIKK